MFNVIIGKMFKLGLPYGDYSSLVLAVCGDLDVNSLLGLWWSKNDFDSYDRTSLLRMLSLTQACGAYYLLFSEVTLYPELTASSDKLENQHICVGAF